ncbi:MAG: UbiA family prenyltransferase [Pseudomonadota bacterium]
MNMRPEMITPNEPSAAPVVAWVCLDTEVLAPDDALEERLRTWRRHPLLHQVAAPFEGGGFTRTPSDAGLSQAATDPALRCYDRAMLERLRSAHAAGFTIVAISSKPVAEARAIALHVGAIDRVVPIERTASDSPERAGNEAPPHQLAHALANTPLDGVGPNPEVRHVSRLADLKTATTEADHAKGAPRRLTPYVRALRPHQWFKNALIGVPLVMAHQALNPASMGAVAIAIIAFSLCASAVYIINDVIDLDDDRRHPRKRNRPFAARDLPLLHAPAMIAGLLITSFALALALPTAFIALLALYFAITLGYSLVFKRMLLVDVITLASLFTVRVLAGSAALAIPPSFWLLAFSVFLFFSLALVKRYTELANEVQVRRFFERDRGYRNEDRETLSQLGIASGMMAVLVLALYINSDVVSGLYPRPYLIWLLCPLMMYLIGRIWILARRSQLPDDPVFFVVTDWRSLVIMALGGALLVAAAW